MSNPTEKQLKFIEAIEDEIGHKFKGSIKQEASEYISKWKDKAFPKEENDWAIINGY